MTLVMPPSTSTSTSQIGTRTRCLAGRASRVTSVVMSACAIDRRTSASVVAQLSARRATPWRPGDQRKNRQPERGLVRDDLHLLARLHLLALAEVVEHAEPVFLVVGHHHPAGEGLDGVTGLDGDDVDA